MCVSYEVANRDLNTGGGIQDDGGSEEAIARALGGVDDVNSGEQNGGSPLEDGCCLKRKKTRRGKSKRRNPYPREQLRRAQQFAKQARQKRRRRPMRTVSISHGQALAPYNTTQFLMEDHGSLEHLDDRLKSEEAATTMGATHRHRDSSFSGFDSETYYSSPEDEKEFLTKEFDNAYEDLHVERLYSLSKAELVQEYLELERKMERIGTCVKSRPGSENGMDTNSEDDTVMSITVYQQEISRLVVENDALRKENEFLRNSRTVSSLSTSLDSESDSSGSSSSSQGETGEATVNDADEQCVDAKSLQNPSAAC